MRISADDTEEYNYNLRGVQTQSDVVTTKVSEHPHSMGVQNIAWGWNSEISFWPQYPEVTFDYDFADSGHEILVNHPGISELDDEWEAPDGWEDPFDWVAWLACAWTDPMSIADSSIVEDIGTNACEDDAPNDVILGLNFDYEVAALDSTLTLLQERGGNCFAFATLMKDMCEVQGVTDVVIESVESTGVRGKSATGQWDYWGTGGVDRDGDSGLGHKITGAPQPYILPGYWIWRMHAFCSYSGRIYDLAIGNDFTGDWKQYLFTGTDPLMNTFINESRQVSTTTPPYLETLTPPGIPQPGSIKVVHLKDLVTDKHADGTVIWYALP